MKKILVICLNIVQLIGGPLCIIYLFLFEEHDSLILVLAYSLSAQLSLIFWEFVIFIYHLASDSVWVNKQEPVLVYFSKPANRFFLKSLSFGFLVFFLTILTFLLFDSIQT